MRHLAALLGLGLALAQQPGQTTQDLVLHIDVNLVQVDAIVTDSKGRQVTDLKPEDFEILEDGKPQKVTHLSYVRLHSASQPPSAKKPAAAVLDEPPQHALARDQVNRTIVLVADDLGLSFESTANVRRALKKFVDERLQPGDLVAILRTSAGMGALQGFTSDKAQLYAAIDAVRWYVNGRGGIAAFDPYVPDPTLSRSPVPASPTRSGSAQHLEQLDEELSEEENTAGTLGALTQVIQDLGPLPGRKGVILFSDGVPLFLRGTELNRTRDLLRRVADQANRSSVVLNTVDARGLVYLGGQAADNFLTEGDFDQHDAVMNTRENDFIDSQQGLQYLAAETGGRFLHDGNDLSWAVDRVMDDLNSYYLIGYKPDPATWERDRGAARFHRIRVRVLRPGLHVRSRTGFYGVADEELKRSTKTREASLLEALRSPFGAKEIPVKLTCIFMSDGKHSHILAMLHIDSRTLTFTEQPDGTRRTELDLLITGHDQNGYVLERVDTTAALTFTPAEWKNAQVNGILYSANVPLERAGAARFRAAVRDTASGVMGSANEFVRVPDLKKGRLTVGGIALGRTEARTGNDTPAVRMFGAGKPITYRFSVYNMKAGAHGAQSRITTRLRVLHDGQETFVSDELPLDVTFEKASRGIAIEGAFQMAKNSAPGEYFLEVIARDTNAAPKRAVASLWSSFEITASH